jgi:hypothetical protein
MEKTGNAIFISYRREDGAAFAGRLFDRLSGRFGAERVFMDVDDIEPGRDFVAAIEEAVAASSVLLVVIGRSWLRREIDDEDFVHREILAALRQGLKVIPILIEGASMPAAADLPGDLASFTRKNAIILRDSHFHDDVAVLLGILERELPRRRGGKRGWAWVASLAAALLLVLGGIYWYRAAGFDPASLAGNWRAEVVTSQGYRYSIDFHFVVLDGTLTGTVRYPTGLAVIGEADVDGSRLAFQSEHVPQFETEKALIRFRGRVVEDKIEFLMQTDQGQEEFVARRPSP